MKHSHRDTETQRHREQPLHVGVPRFHCDSVAVFGGGGAATHGASDGVIGTKAGAGSSSGPSGRPLTSAAISLTRRK